MPIVDPKDLIGRTFLQSKNEDGTRMRVKIVSQIEDCTDKMKKDPNLIKFLCSVNDDEYEELLSYDKVLDHIEKDETQDVLWKFKNIQAHEGPLDKSHRNYNGSSYNLLIEWKMGKLLKNPQYYCGR